MYKLTSCILFLFLLLPSLLISQELPFTHFTTESELMPLPAAANTALYQDQQGFIWMNAYGTGLVRYDGKKMEVLDAEKNGINGYNWVIFEDNLGRLWTGSREGVFVSSKPLREYAPGENITFSDSLAGKFPLSKNKVGTAGNMFKDTKGRIWVSTPHGILRYTFEGLKDLHIDTLEVNLGYDGVKTSMHAFTERKNGDIWAASGTGQILIYPKGESPYSSLDDLVDPISTENSRITFMIEDDSGNMWGGTNKGVIWNKSPNQGFQQKKYPGFTSVTTGIYLKDGSVLLGNLSQGILQFHLDSPEKTQRYTIAEALLNDAIWDFIQDREGNIWIAQNTGLSRLQEDYQGYGHYTGNAANGKSPMLPTSATTVVVSDIKIAGDSYLMTGSTKGIALIDEAGSSEWIQAKDGLLSDIVLNIEQDALGRIWVTSRAGLSCILPARMSCELPGANACKTINIHSTELKIVQIPSGFSTGIKAFAIPKTSASPETELSVWTLDSHGIKGLIGNTWYVMKPGSGLGTGPYTGAILTPDNYLYVISRSSGLYKSIRPLNVTGFQQINAEAYEEPVFKDFKKVNDPFFEPVDIVVEGDSLKKLKSIAYEKSRIWIASLNSLIGLNGKTSDLEKVFQLKDSLGDFSLVDLLYSNHSESFWGASANRGLIEIDEETGEILSLIDKKEGLVENIPWGQDILSESSTGRLAFGSSAGVSFVNPRLDKRNTTPASLAFRNLTYSEDAQGNNEILVEYVGLSFSDEKSVRYKTRMKGYDKDWSSPTDENKIRYTNLSAFFFPKTYAFEVQASNNHGLWSEALSHEFKVSPPWWLTWWAFLLYACLIFLGISQYVKYKTQKQAIALEQEKEVSQKLRRVDKLKDQFLANTSHELRTPLHGIIGLAESLYGQAQTDNQQENLGMIIASGKRLSSLVNDLLDFSKAKNRDLNLQQKAVGLRPLVELIFQSSFSLLGKQDIRLLNEIPTDTPAVWADENRLQQIFYNLIGNAIKFTETGHVKVGCSLSEDQNMLIIYVEDTGIGIPKDKREAIFQEFEQLDGSINREFSGTGLGLSISKRLTELHGGEMWVESQIGKSSTFYFSLPLAPENIPIEQTQITSLPLENTAFVSPKPYMPSIEINLEEGLHGEHVRVLIVDDEPINHQVIKNYLLSNRIEIVSAMNGQEALKIVQESESFDLILLDIMMPRMSGYEVCKKIRDSYLASEMPVIMVTAKSQMSDLIEGLDTGANDYITKPFSKDEFLARIKTHLNLHRINKATGKFVPNEFIRALGRDSITDVRLGDNSAQTVTVFFSDIRSYTSLAESMNPEDNFKFVNAYAGRMGPVIKANQGFVNQYLGDGIMAIFKESPDDALKAAIEMQQKLKAYNLDRKANGRKELKVGMGMHTGPLIMGIIGDAERTDAATISDAVNTAARMEGLTKSFGVDILISESTYDQLQYPENYNFRYLGKVQVKGRSTALGIYECLDIWEDEELQIRLKNSQKLQEGLDAYYAKDFAVAVDIFKALLEKIPGDKSTQRYLNHASQFLDEGVDETWTGVEEMTSK